MTRQESSSVTSPRRTCYRPGVSIVERFGLQNLTAVFVISEIEKGFPKPPAQKRFPSVLPVQRIAPILPRTEEARGSNPLTSTQEALMRMGASVLPAVRADPLARDGSIVRPECAPDRTLCSWAQPRGGRGIKTGVVLVYSWNSSSSPHRLSARASSIGTPLTRVISKNTNTGEISVTHRQPLSTGRAMIATPVHRMISPK